MNYKHIHIGSLIKMRVIECEIDLLRICNFMKCTEEELDNMYQSENLDTAILLSWSKLLEYDFFRIYTQHLILFAPQQRIFTNEIITKTSLPKIRKNIYTKEVIEFILEKIKFGEMTKTQIIHVYQIPKTTLYKWIAKY